MGTNYYAVKILDRKGKDKLKQAISLLRKRDVSSFSDAMDLLEEYSKEYIRGLHIGKKSYGWQFLFDLNEEKYYKPTKQSIKAFLSDGYKIMNEYGERVTKRDFWKMVNQSMRDKNNYWNAKYEEEKPSESSWVHREPYTELGRKYFAAYGDFKHDGLRFSEFTDFG